MIFDGKEVGDNYSPSQMLDLCRVDLFDGPNWDGAKHYVAQILALVVTERDPNRLREKLEQKVREIGKVSIGQSLERLHSVATLGPELDGDLTGIAALTYHLSGDTCQKGISALQAVLRQFDIDQKVKDAQ